MLMAPTEYDTVQVTPIWSHRARGSGYRLSNPYPTLPYPTLPYPTLP